MNTKLVRQLEKITSILTCLAFISLTMVSEVHTQGAMKLPAPGLMISPSDGYDPLVLQGLKIDPENPFKFEFILNEGDTDIRGVQLNHETKALIKYFLSAITIPEKDLWVNLSPYEKNKIISSELGLTEMGRDMLSQDYLLKQLTASLMHPEGEVGKPFWERVRERALKKFGTADIPVNTLNKVWIMPETVKIYEDAQTSTAFIVESRLKVMLEQDYVAQRKMSVIHDQGLKQVKTNITHNLSAQIIREIIIPEIEKEVNQGRHFSKLRQIFSAIILANWYKNTLKESLLVKGFADQYKMEGINISNPKNIDQIYDQYVRAYKKGAYNFIQEEYDEPTRKMIPRKYFSGGLIAATRNTEEKVTDGAMLEYFRRLSVSRLALAAVTLFVLNAGPMIESVSAQNAYPFMNHLLNDSELPIFEQFLAENPSPVEQYIAISGGKNLTFAEFERSFFNGDTFTGDPLWYPAFAQALTNDPDNPEGQALLRRLQSRSGFKRLTSQAKDDLISFVYYASPGNAGLPPTLSILIKEGVSGAQELVDFFSRNPELWPGFGTPNFNDMLTRSRKGKRWGKRIEYLKRHLKTQEKTEDPGNEEEDLEKSAEAEETETTTTFDETAPEAVKFDGSYVKDEPDPNSIIITTITQETSWRVLARHLYGSERLAPGLVSANFRNNTSFGDSFLDSELTVGDSIILPPSTDLQRRLREDFLDWPQLSADSIQERSDSDTESEQSDSDTDGAMLKPETTGGIALDDIKTEKVNSSVQKIRTFNVDPAQLQMLQNAQGLDVQIDGITPMSIKALPNYLNLNQPTNLPH